MPDQDLSARLDNIERVLGLQRMGADASRLDSPNSNVSDHCGNSGMSYHCTGIAEATDLATK